MMRTIIANITDPDSLEEPEPIHYCENCGVELTEREYEDGCLCDTCREEGYSNDDF